MVALPVGDHPPGVLHGDATGGDTPLHSTATTSARVPPVWSVATLSARNCPMVRQCGQNIATGHGPRAGSHTRVVISQTRYVVFVHHEDNAKDWLVTSECFLTQSTIRIPRTQGDGDIRACRANHVRGTVGSHLEGPRSLSAPPHQNDGCYVEQHCARGRVVRRPYVAQDRLHRGVTIQRTLSIWTLCVSGP